MREHTRETPGELPAGCTGRFREKWRPLKRVAELAEYHTEGHEWKDVVDAMVTRDLEEAEEERRAGLRQQPPGLVLMCDLYEIWPTGEGEQPKVFVPTGELIELLLKHNPNYWDASITAQRSRLSPTRLGRMIRQATKATSTAADTTSHRPGGGGSPRGYYRTQFERVWKKLRVAELIEARGGRDSAA